MQVQRVQQNNSQPQFGLLIPKNVTPEALAKKGQGVIEALKEVRELVKDTRFVHMEIVGEDVTPRVLNCIKHFDPQIDELYPEFLKINTIWDGANMGTGAIPGQPYTLTVKLPNEAAALKAYQGMKETTSQYKRAGILTKILDDREVKKYVQKQNEKVDYAKTLNMADTFLKSLEK